MAIKANKFVTFWHLPSALYLVFDTQIIIRYVMIESAQVTLYLQDLCSLKIDSFSEGFLVFQIAIFKSNERIVSMKLHPNPRHMHVHRESVEVILTRESKVHKLRSFVRVTQFDLILSPESRSRDKNVVQHWRVSNEIVCTILVQLLQYVYSVTFVVEVAEYYGCGEKGVK